MNIELLNEAENPKREVDEGQNMTGNEPGPRKTKHANNLLKIGIIILFILIGLFSISLFSNYKKESKEKVKANLIVCMKGNHTKDKGEVYDHMESAFKKLSSGECTELLDVLLHATYSMASQYSINDSVANMLYSVYVPGKGFELEKIAETETKKLCEELNAQHIIPVFINGDLFFDVDYSYFIKRYGTYINKDYLDLITLYQEEKVIDYYNSETLVMNYDVVESRLLNVYEIIKKHPQSELLEAMMDYYLFYKNVYFGAYSQDYVFDSGSKIHLELFSHYQDFVTKVKDPELSEFMRSLISAYEVAEFSRTVSIYEKITNFCGAIQSNNK